MSSASTSGGARGWERFKQGWHRFWSTDDTRVALVRDVAVIGLLMLILLGSVWAYTGQPFPRSAPLVVVESGSMMHGPHRSGNTGAPTGWDDPPFGRMGTIDPGDLVFVKDIDAWTDIDVVFSSGGRSGYGSPGDVVVYSPGGEDSTPIIHRAMLFVEETSGDGCRVSVDCVYRIPAACEPGFSEWVLTQGPTPASAYCEGSSVPIRMTLERDGLRLRLSDFPSRACSGNACPMFYAGIVTKGDNNPSSDQATESGGCFQANVGCISPLVELDWVMGKARGEVPWVGMIKLALYGNPNYNAFTDPTQGPNWKIIRGTAPADIWVMLFVTLGVVILVPMGVDLVMNRVRARRADDGPGSPPGAGR